MIKLDLSQGHESGSTYADHEAIVRTGHGTTDWFQIGKEVHQGCILSPCLFNFYAVYPSRLDRRAVSLASPRDEA